MNPLVTTAVSLAHFLPAVSNSLVHGAVIVSLFPSLFLGFLFTPITAPGPFRSYRRSLTRYAHSCPPPLRVGTRL